jgi:hypothetical protein
MFRHALICFVFVAFATPGHTEPNDADRSPPSPAVRQVELASHEIFGQPRDWIGDASAQAQLLKAIASWLSTTFELPPIDSIPRIKLESGPRITAFRFTGRLPDRQEDVTRLPPGNGEVTAIYDPGTDTIYLREGWTGRTPAQMSILVHEMVHYVQDVADFKFPCVQASEELAYLAQDRWLGLFDTDLATEFGIDRFTRFVNTRCFH